MICVVRKESLVAAAEELTDRGTAAATALAAALEDGRTIMGARYMRDNGCLVLRLCRR